MAMSQIINYETQAARREVARSISNMSNRLNSARQIEIASTPENFELNKEKGFFDRSREPIETLIERTNKLSKSIETLAQYAEDPGMCKVEKKFKTFFGGIKFTKKEKIADVNEEIKSILDSENVQNALKATGIIPEKRNERVEETIEVAQENTGLSTPAKVGIAAGAAGVVGAGSVVAYLGKEESIKLASSAYQSTATNINAAYDGIKAGAAGAFQSASSTINGAFEKVASMVPDTSAQREAIKKFVSEKLTQVGNGLNAGVESLKDLGAKAQKAVCENPKTSAAIAIALVGVGAGAVMIYKEYSKPTKEEEEQTQEITA